MLFNCSKHRKSIGTQTLPDSLECVNTYSPRAGSNSPKPFWNNHCAKISQTLWIPLDHDEKGNPPKIINASSWFSVTYQTNPKFQPKLYPKKFCALDPGTNNFQTIYSPEHIIQIIPNKKLIEKLQIIRQQDSDKYEKKLSYLIDDLHGKVIKYLTENYEIIIMPTFGRKKPRQSRNNEDNYNDIWNHNLFREKLEKKCKRKQRILDICTEEYTSQICGRCGKCARKNDPIMFNCTNPECKLSIHRDYNAARNIAIKRLLENTALFEK